MSFAQLFPIQNQKSKIQNALTALSFMLLCVTVSAAEDWSFPGGVRMSEPYETMVGAQRVTVQGFSTEEAPEALRLYYEQTLEKQGWRIRQLPWWESAQAQMKRFKQAMLEHPEHMSAAEITSRLEDFDEGKLQRLAKRQLYAARERRRLLINFSTQGRRTLVFMNRWEEPETLEEVGSLKGERNDQAFFGLSQELRQMQAGEGSRWPEVNPCCSGESVPNELRKLPSTIPQYPHGRMISTAAAPIKQNRQGVMSEMYMTEDSVNQVADFYRIRMGYNGWTESETPEDQAAVLAQLAGSQGSSLNAQQLLFRNDSGMCVVAIVEKPATPPMIPPPADVAGGEMGGSLPSESSQPMDDMSERTIIMVNYIEGSLVSRVPAYRPPATIRSGR